MRQGIPEACDTEAILHRYDLRGRQEDNWMDRHQEYIQRWNSRCDHITNAEAFSEVLHIMIHIWFGIIRSHVYLPFLMDHFITYW